MELLSRSLDNSSGRDNDEDRDSATHMFKCNGKNNKNGKNGNDNVVEKPPKEHKHRNLPP
jgi:hypothetical protein